MNASSQLASFIVNTKYSDIPQDILKKAKNLILDTFGCAVGGYTIAKEECQWVLDSVKELGGTPEATVWIDGHKTSSVNAALANGTMTCTIDFDDTHMFSYAHLGPSLLATTLSVGEKVGATGEEALTAFLVGFEVAARAGNSVNSDGKTHYKYWHPTATIGTIGSSAVAAKLMNLNELQTEQALGLGVDQAAGFRYCIDKGDYTKSLHAGQAAMRAVLSATLVKNGSTGPKGLLEFETGFCNSMSSKPVMEDLTVGLGKEFLIVNDALKFYPTIHCSQTNIEAMEYIVNENNLKAEDIAKIDVNMSGFAKGQGANSNPETPMAARLSIPFCLALVGAKGRNLLLTDFVEENLNDPKIKELINKVSVEIVDEYTVQYPSGLVGHVTVTTKDNQSYEKMIVYPKGHPERPASDEEIYNKFRYLAGLTWNEEKVESVLQKFIDFENIDSINNLVSQLK
jgi:2-methylcitrate dehydratase PrpD